MPPKNPGMRRSRLLSIREQLGGGNIGETNGLPNTGPSGDLIKGSGFSRRVPRAPGRHRLWPDCDWHVEPALQMGNSSPGACS